MLIFRITIRCVLLLIKKRTKCLCIMYIVIKYLGINDDVQSPLLTSPLGPAHRCPLTNISEEMHA